jgi:hypothetical protein
MVYVEKSETDRCFHSHYIYRKRGEEEPLHP